MQTYLSPGPVAFSSFAYLGTLPSITMSDSLAAPDVDEHTHHSDTLQNGARHGYEKRLPRP